MKRRQPSVSPEQAQELWNARSGAGESVTVQCQLVTPMYGGGVNAGEVDKAMPIRASGIRGQLRFWWRLLYGGDRNPKELFEKECKLWGGIASSGPTASKVALRVACEPAVSFVGKRDVPPYVLILEASDEPVLLAPRYSFGLQLDFAQATDAQRSEVIQCVRWWVSFGGVGARTRRGLGTIKARSDDVNLTPVSSTESDGLGGRMVIGPPMQDAKQAWSVAVGALQDFRQGQGVGRKSGKGRPCGSNWPEAETIRRLAEKAKPAPKDGEESFFPRAAFGLPIVFQFKGEKHLNDTLEGENHERMASPLILRPYFNGRQYCPTALLLPGWRSSSSMSVKLKGRGRAFRSWPSDDDERQEDLAKSVAPMASRGSDPLSAFMHYFEQRVNASRR